MASEPLPANHLKAGQDYLSALLRLGLRPSFLAWGQQVQSNDWMLVMVTPVLEISGPLALSRLLFKAYNAKVTPQTISPFIVRAYGARTEIAPFLEDFGTVDITNATMQVVDENTNEEIGETHKIRSMRKTFADFRIENEHIYKVSGAAKRSHQQRTSEWLRFKGNVERLAA